jgi:hypothetical protein
LNRDNHPRRPGQAKREPGPQRERNCAHRYAVSSRLSNGADAFYTEQRQGLWVPAQGRDDKTFWQSSSRVLPWIASLTLAMTVPLEWLFEIRIGR